jgi:hypothetical protein
MQPLPPLPPLSDSLSTLLIAIAAFLSNWLRSKSSLPLQWNIVIALGALVVCTIFTFWMAFGFVYNLQTTVALMIVLGVYLGGRQLSALLGYIESASSPLTRFFPDLVETRRLPAIPRRASLTVPMQTSAQPRPPQQQPPNQVQH